MPSRRSIISEPWLTRKPQPLRATCASATPGLRSFFGVGCATAAFQHTSFADNMSSAHTSWISSVSKLFWTLNPTVCTTGAPTNRKRMQSAMRGSKPEPLRCYVSGILASDASETRSVKRSGGNCKQGRRIRCRIIANRQMSRLTSNREVPDDVSFPLTPALSLGEREDVPQVHCE